MQEDLRDADIVTLYKNKEGNLTVPTDLYYWKNHGKMLHSKLIRPNHC